MKKNEINLSLIDIKWEEFTYLGDELSIIKGLQESLEPDSSNSLIMKIRLIDGPHYELEMKYSLKTKRQCSRCGKDFIKKIEKEDYKDYLSTDLKEGEDEGFVLVEQPQRWDWAEYFRQTIELEVPFQELCALDCKPSDARVILEGQKKINSPFDKLKSIKISKKH